MYALFPLCADTNPRWHSSLAQPSVALSRWRDAYHLFIRRIFILCHPGVGVNESPPETPPRNLPESPPVLCGGVHVPYAAHNSGNVSRARDATGNWVCSRIAGKFDAWIRNIMCDRTACRKGGFYRRQWRKELFCVLLRYAPGKVIGLFFVGKILRFGLAMKCFELTLRKFFVYFHSKFQRCSVCTLITMTFLGKTCVNGCLLVKRNFITKFFVNE